MNGLVIPIPVKMNSPTPPSQKLRDPNPKSLKGLSSLAKKPSALLGSVPPPEGDPTCSGRPPADPAIDAWTLTPDLCSSVESGVIGGFLSSRVIWEFEQQSKPVAVTECFCRDH